MWFSVLLHKNAEATGGISILIFTLKICFQTPWQNHKQAATVKFEATKNAEYNAECKIVLQNPNQDVPMYYEQSDFKQELQQW